MISARDRRPISNDGRILQNFPANQPLVNAK
jgi:hypothetical protein